MELRPGYKQTEMGCIPEDWEVKTIDQVAFVTSGKRLPLGSSLVDLPTPHPYIRVTDMRVGSVDLSQIRYVPESVFPAIKQYRIYRSDIFISVAGTLGIVGKIPAELDGANLTENADRITNITCSHEYLLYVLMSPLIQDAIDSIRTVGAQPKLALTRIRKFAIPLPPSEAEQRAIAFALSDVDALLACLDRLIAKKRDLKQAAMQQLLTGKTRLWGFKREWEVKRLGEVVKFEKGCLITEDDAVPGAIPVIAGGKKPAYFHNRSNRTGKTITISASGANAGYVAFFGEPIFASDCTTISDSEDYSIEFVYFQLQWKQSTIYKAQTGGAQPHVHAADISPIEVIWPAPPEQTVIASILSDMDAEISRLEARRDKTRALKQGMMQELLTGRTRLI